MNDDDDDKEEVEEAAEGALAGFLWILFMGATAAVFGAGGGWLACFLRGR